MNQSGANYGLGFRPPLIGIGKTSDQIEARMIRTDGRSAHGLKQRHRYVGAAGILSSQIFFICSDKKPRRCGASWFNIIISELVTQLLRG